MITDTTKTSRLPRGTNRLQPTRINGHLTNPTNGKLPPKLGRGARGQKLVAGHAEETRQAILLAGKGAAACSIRVDYAAETPRIDVSVGKHTLLAGLWDVAISIDGRPIELSPEWEYLCWHSDENAHYLELQCLGDGIVSIERQILLPRRGDFALLADAVIAPAGHRLDYTAKLPLADEIKVTPDRHTRELRLSAAKQIARVYPLALPQDRIDGTAGALDSSAEKKLQLKQAAPGRSLYAPLVIDWNASRRNAPADWRTLTVTEEAGILRPEQAAGQRLRVGSDQWLIYRSLINSPEPRSVLGHQTRYETVVGRFNAKGDVKAILEIE